MIDHFPALSIALLDRKARGVDAEVKKSGGMRVVSKEFGIDRPIDCSRLMSELGNASGVEKVSVAAIVTAMAYLSSSGHRLDMFTVELSNSPIFGAKDEKSGLGSSAASTVSAVGAVFEGNGLPLTEHRDEIHKIAQIAHALATGKVGSGFDIATSSFGSIEYERFSSDCIDLGSLGQADEEFARKIVGMVSGSWKRMAIMPFSLEGFGLLAFNIRGAKTSTVSSVRAIRKLIEYTPEIYKTQIIRQAEGEKRALSGIKKNDPAEIRAGIHAARDAQNRMSGWAIRIGMMDFDPIEPPILTKIIAEAESIDGVVAGRCPGSGGYDSLVFLAKAGTAGLAEKIAAIGTGAGLSLERIDAQVSGSGVRTL